MLQIAVLDDEEFYIEQIRKLTKESLVAQGLAYELKAYTRARNLFDDLDDGMSFDIFLLDMELPEMTGIDVARRIRKEHMEPALIYITNFVEYAVEAFEVNTYRYIPKSLLNERLPEAFASLCPEILEKRREVYVIEKNHELDYIPYQDIYCLKKEGKYVLLVHKRGESRARKTLGEVLEEMYAAGKKQFLMIDRGCVVNIFHIMSLKEQQIVLRDGSILPISKPKLNQVKAQIMEYQRR